MKKTTAAVAVAALALPAAAQADRPQDPGSKGKTRSAEAKAGQQKGKKTKGVGFSVSGVALEGLALDQAGTGVAGPFSLDLTSASGHALKALELAKGDVAKQEAVAIPAVAGDAVKVSFEGVTDGADQDTSVGLADVVATDRVKVVGKVARTVTKGRTAKGAKFTYGAIDIKKIVITRGETEQD
jgi:hypothetical protein